MTARQPELFDVVARLRDVPEEKLERGDVGTVVEMTHDPAVVFVEFSDSDGRTTALPALRIADLLVLRHEAATAAE